MKKTIAFLLALMMCLPLCACSDNAAVTALDNEILKIGEVSLDSEELIISLENKYAKLSEKEQNALSNYYVLTQARKKLDELKKVQKFAEKLSLCFTETISSSDRDNIKFQNCWYYFDGDRYYFTYYISTMSGSGFDYQYWGTPKGYPYSAASEYDYYGIQDLSDEEIEKAIATCTNRSYLTNYYWAIQKDEKYALREGGIELDAEAIQDYYMRYS